MGQWVQVLLGFRMMEVLEDPEVLADLDYRNQEALVVKDMYYNLDQDNCKVSGKGPDCRIRMWLNINK